jgi:hypothetical protein
MRQDLDEKAAQVSATPARQDAGGSKPLSRTIIPRLRVVVVKQDLPVRWVYIEIGRFCLDFVVGLSLGWAWSNRRGNIAAQWWLGRRNIWREGDDD